MNLKTTFSAAALALTMGAALAASTTSAEAQWGRRGGWGPGIALGLGGAVLGGAIIANQRPYYGGGYYAAPVYGGGCWRERRAVHDQWGNFRGYRVMRVCG